MLYWDFGVYKFRYWFIPLPLDIWFYLFHFQVWHFYYLLGTFNNGKNIKVYNCSISELWIFFAGQSFPAC